MPDYSRMRLGKQPPILDERTLRLASYIGAELPPPPDELDLVSKVSPRWRMYLNDQIGDCTCASLGHGVHFWTKANDNESPPTDADILKAYRESCGYDPAKPETDRGGIMLLVANYFRQVGIGGHKPAAFVALDPTNEKHLKHALNLFGGAYVGVGLPVSAQRQDRWHVALAGTDGDPTPGSWGLHAIWVLPLYDRDGVWCVTWGGLQKMSWGWFQVCNDEGYAFLSRDWADADGAPNGLAYDRLLDDLARVSS